MAILAGLGSASVHRLKATKHRLSAGPRASWEALSALMAHDGSYRKYRVDLARARRAPPYVPYLGVHLTDLTFVADGNKDTLAEAACEPGAPPRELINLGKRQQVHSILQACLSGRTARYTFSALPGLAMLFDAYAQPGIEPLAPRLRCRAVWSDAVRHSASRCAVRRASVRKRCISRSAGFGRWNPARAPMNPASSETACSCVRPLDCLLLCDDECPPDCFLLCGDEWPLDCFLLCDDECPPDCFLLCGDECPPDCFLLCGDEWPPDCDHCLDSRCCGSRVECLSTRFYGATPPRGAPPPALPRPRRHTHRGLRLPAEGHAPRRLRPSWGGNRRGPLPTRPGGARAAAERRPRPPPRRPNRPTGEGARSPPSAAAPAAATATARVAVAAAAAAATVTTMAAVGWRRSDRRRAQ